ncbi:MAG: mandelate racemase/muconate lactonizing enzyme family protein [Bryobacterales bacterium]|nr:mandelate racemase/muconate lactonizing enzyme family protein [Bryobacteraceae bacterium]MDW8354524.1 mandelate racemase/muconate lactonizing enzyme family protein [Bryobacterales bacterium]
MRRREFLSVGLAGAAATARPAPAVAAPGPMKITRIRFYRDPNSRPIFNQSSHIVTVETDQGITGIGEGGSKDTIEQCAAMLIGEDPFRIEHLWQLMYRGYFYPPGREKLHALGALDLALWDIKGKALGVPVYELLGGATREHIECYSTGFPSKGSLRETARACIEAGFRAFRTSMAGPQGDAPFDAREMVRKTVEQCREIREGVGKDGDWAIDIHTRLDFADAVRLCTLLEDLDPFFVEDLVRSENPAVYRTLRPQVKVPIAVGEQFGDRWEINELVEQHLIDYSRVTIPNCGGVTEFMKIAALCETHYVGLVPHFTGPVATAAVVHCCAAFSGPVLMEMLGAGPREVPHLPQHFDFRNGKLWPNRRPGLGVEFDAKRLPLIAEVTERSRPIPLYRRRDGSITNW